jgi:ABC-type nitrate/sulfonate/bicarbonate transport system substrate-binding protein
MRLVRMLAAFIVAACAVPFASAQSSAAPALKAVRVIAFGGGWNLPMWVAQRQGFFERQGVAVQLAFTPNSGFLIEGLMADRFEIGLASIDNLIAYQEGQGDGAPLRDPDLFAFMGADNGFLSVVAAPSIASMADLRGRTLAVDSLNTGFAFVLRELLRRNGIADGDVTWARAGATDLRYRDLVAGKYDATLLRTPFDILAAERGFRAIASADTLGPYLGTSGLARRSWARANEATLVGFLRAYRDAMGWLADPANRPVAEALLVANIRDMTPALAQSAAARLLAQPGGLLRNLEIDPAALRTVIALRERYGEPRKTLGDIDRYIDLGYREKALAPR